MRASNPFLALSLARRMMLGTAAIGLALALFLSGLHILDSYRDQNAELEQHVAEIAKSNLPPLREALWLGDTVLVQAHLNGLRNIEGLVMVQVERDGKPPLSAGRPPAPGNRPLERLIPIRTTFMDREVALGSLRLVFDLERSFDRFRAEALAIFVAQVIQVALIAGSVLVLFQRLAGRRLRDMAGFLSSAQAGRGRLPAGEGRTNDELELLARSFNALMDQQDRHLKELVEAGERLEERVAERTRELSAEVAEHERTRKVLERSNTDLEQFAYAASHDLREPLRTINSYLGLLEHRLGDKLDETNREFMEFARDGARRMDVLVHDLLEFSRIGRQPDSKERLDLGEAMQEALANLSVAIRKAGALVTIADPLPPVFGNRSELVRLFQNLIGNAVKYAAKGRTPEVTVRTRRDGDSWLFEVVDNGIGIAPQYLEKVFGIFQRLHGQGEYEGTGIGLASCRRIVENHGGRIWAESVPGEGSTFRFTLPALTEG